MPTIHRLTADEARDQLANLIDLLRDAVDDGASIGFMPPLAAGDAWDYWEQVISGVADTSRLLLVAMVDDVVAGSVQLALEKRPNGAHRADVQKLIVHRQFRQQGLGQTLMNAVEASAREYGRHLLVLDTVQGGTAEHLYRKLGYTEAGIIPDYALNGSGGADATVIFYKQLGT